MAHSLKHLRENLQIAWIIDHQAHKILRILWHPDGIEIIGEPAQQPLAAGIQVQRGVVESLPILPGARHHLIFKISPLTAPIVAKAPGTQKQDFLILVPKFAEGSGR